MLFTTSRGLKSFTVPSKWMYRGEGNCNVVISLPNTRKVLRIRKTQNYKSLLSWLIRLLAELIYWCRGERASEEVRDLKFYKNIMRPLLGSQYVCDAEPVIVSKKQVNILESDLAKMRPDFRKHKSLQHGRAAVFEDYAFLPNDFYPFQVAKDTFAIEIKPKHGWTPFSERLFSKCNFCMYQYLKLKQGQIVKFSSYCPEDLFSGEKTRMIRAIKSLIRSPQNNFRVFKNGKLFYDDRSLISSFNDIIIDFFNNEIDQDCGFEEFASLIQQSLVTNFEEEAKPNKCEQKLFCEWNHIIQNNSLYNKLPRGCVLEKILSIQMLDVEGNEYYYKLLGNKKVQNFNYVNNLLDEISKSSNTCLKCLIMMLGNVDPSESDLALAPYLISAIAKDCSLMLTFKKIEDSKDNLGMKNIIRSKHGNFIVNVGVFDLYPKPISTIKKHRRKIAKMLQIDLNDPVKF